MRYRVYVKKLFGCERFAGIYDAVDEKHALLKAIGDYAIRGLFTRWHAEPWP